MCRLLLLVLGRSLPALMALFLLSCSFVPPTENASNLRVFFPFRLAAFSAVGNSAALDQLEGEKWPTGGEAEERERKMRNCVFFLLRPSSAFGLPNNCICLPNDECVDSALD